MTESQGRTASLLHQQALKIARELEHQEYLMIEVLQRIDHAKAYRVLGFRSLFEYTTVALKLGRDRAYNFIQVARKAKQVDRLQAALKSQEITLSKAKRIASVVNNKNAEKWLTLSRNLTQRELERAVAKVNPKTLVEEGTRFVSENMMEMKIAIGVDTERLLKRVLIKRVRGNARENSSQRPVKFRKRSTVQQTPRQANALARRTSIPSVVKNQVFLRDQGQCQAPGSDGRACGESRWVDLHHKIPVSRVGSDTIENLLTLCKAHHQMEHTFVPLELGLARQNGPL